VIFAVGKHYRIDPLGKPHDRQAFTCGVDSLDGYLKTQASQDMKRKSTAVFILSSAESPEKIPTTILGYFSLSAYALEQDVIPEVARRHLPRYPMVGATLIGRLAVASAWQGRGLGAVLLSEALRKAYENAAVVGSSMVVVDALDESAANFYARSGFLKLPDSMRLILPMATIGEILK
jgi:GNAT superfamily N-acetyltransferase